MKDRLLKDLFIGFIKVHILYHTDKEPIYGQEFSKELKRHGYVISFGTLYPVFHRLEIQGYLRSTRENVNGKLRRFYVITKRGKRMLERAKLQAKELVEELFED
jgi:DNA-binding PadR family transcriptional regulator